MLTVRVHTQGVVKRFFNEKEVTSTLVMDALVSGVKQIEEISRLGESKKVTCLSTSPCLILPPDVAAPCKVYGAAVSCE